MFLVVFSGLALSISALATLATVMFLSVAFAGPPVEARR